MLQPIQIIVTALVLAIAGFIIGAVGFGFGLTTSPTLLLFLDPQTVVVVVNAVAIIAFALVLVETREHAQFREQTPLAIAGAIGTPVGIFALSQLDAAILRIAIGILVLALTALVVFKSEWRVPYPQFTGPILGFVSAAMTTGLTIGGPILVFVLSRLRNAPARTPSIDCLSFFTINVHRGCYRIRDTRTLHCRTSHLDRGGYARRRSSLLDRKQIDGAYERNGLSASGCRSNCGFKCRSHHPRGGVLNHDANDGVLL